MQGQIIKHTTVTDWVNRWQDTNTARWNPVAQKLLQAAKKVEASQDCKK